MLNCEKILICGFSGAGKTTFLTHLKDSCPFIDWSFADLDQIIFSRKGRGKKQLSELIEEVGWEKFRLWERQELEGWLKEEGKGVLALGGGTLSELVFTLYSSHRKVKFCYLHAPFEDCWNRLDLEGEALRPMTKLGREGLEKVYLERFKLFSRIPWIIENSSGSSLEKSSKEFWDYIQKK